jgi:hypothetical protein
MAGFPVIKKEYYSENGHKEEDYAVQQQHPLEHVNDSIE